MDDEEDDVSDVGLLVVGVVNDGVGSPGSGGVGSPGPGGRLIPGGQ